MSTSLPPIVNGIKLDSSTNVDRRPSIESTEGKSVIDNHIESKESSTMLGKESSTMPGFEKSTLKDHFNLTGNPPFNQISTSPIVSHQKKPLHAGEIEDGDTTNDENSASTFGEDLIKSGNSSRSNSISSTSSNNDSQYINANKFQIAQVELYIYSFNKVDDKQIGKAFFRASDINTNNYNKHLYNLLKKLYIDNELLDKLYIDKEDVIEIIKRAECLQNNHRIQLLQKNHTIYPYGNILNEETLTPETNSFYNEEEYGSYKFRETISSDLLNFTTKYQLSYHEIISCLSAGISINDNIPEVIIENKFDVFSKPLDKPKVRKENVIARVKELIKLHIRAHSGFGDALIKDFYRFSGGAGKDSGIYTTLIKNDDKTEEENKDTLNLLFTYLETSFKMAYDLKYNKK